MKSRPVSIATQEQVLPTFAPYEIRAAVSQVLSDGTVVAIRCVVDFTYQINATGASVVNPAGSILGVSPSITSLDFSSPVKFRF